MAACIDVGILHENLPNPFADKVVPKPNKYEDELQNHPPNPPFPTTEKNIGKFKSWVLEDGIQ